MNSCEAIRERLAEAEAAAQEPETKRHLEGCTACRAFLKDLRRLDVALEALPGYDASDELVASTLRAIRRASEKPDARVQPVRNQPYLAAGLAASVVIAAGLALTLGFPQTSNDLGVANWERAAPGDDPEAIKDQLALAPTVKEVPLSSQHGDEPADGQTDTPLEGDYQEPLSETVGGGLSGSIPETFETVQRGEKKAKQDTSRVQEEGEILAGEVRSFEFAEQYFSDEGLQRELDVIALLETRSFAKDRLESASETAAIAGHEAESKPTASATGIASGGYRQDQSSADQLAADLRANQQQTRARKDNEADNDKNIPAKVQGQETGADVPSAAPAPAGELGKAEVSLRSIEGPEEEVLQAYKTRRRKLELDADPTNTRLLAAGFLAGYRSLEDLSFQSASGYWANSYIPGDPALRLLQARLRDWDRTALGQDLQLEQTVRPIAQPFDAPQDAALAVYLQADRPAIEGPTRLRVQVGLQAAERQGGHRPAMNIALLVDLRDGGDADSDARIRALIAALERARQPRDRISLTLAGPEGGLLVAPADFRHGPLRVAMERMFGTPKEAGPSNVGLQQAFILATDSLLEGDDPGAALGSSLVLLVTGSSLTGDLAALERMAHRNAVGGLALSVVSLGKREELGHIDRLVAAGQGNRRVLDRAVAAEGLIDRELHAASRAVARALRLRIRLAPGVRLVDVLGSRPLRQPLAQRVREAEQAIDRRLARNLGILADRGQDEEGIQIVIPSFFAGDSHTILLDLVADKPGPLVDVTLRYKDVAHLKNGVAQANLTIGSGRAVPGAGERHVLKNLVAWEFARQARQASRVLAEGDPEQAARQLALLRDLLHGLRGEVAGWHSDPDLTADEALLEDYLTVLARPPAGDPVQRQHLADSLHLAAFRKLQTAAR